MQTNELLLQYFEDQCPLIHSNRLSALFDVVAALQHSQELTLSSMGRKLSGQTSVKNKIKKTDRLLGNKHLHNELSALYEGLSKFIFTYMTHLKDVPIVVDLCFIKDSGTIQMLSAEVATKGRSIPIYREVFEEGELAGRASNFLAQLKNKLPEKKDIVFVMDAGFPIEWFKLIESFGWNWLSRMRGIKSIKLNDSAKWTLLKDLMPTIGEKTVTYNGAFITETHQLPCRVVTTRKALKGRKLKVSRGRTSSRVASAAYSKSARDPWVLATNLPLKYNATKIIAFYEKRMQIEQSFRDIKSKQFGLAGRNVRTKNINRWAVKMLLAAIVQVTFWVLGVIGHSQGMQKLFQANTVKDRKVFSYFTLGRFIIEYDKLNEIKYTDHIITEIIQNELARNG